MSHASHRRRHEFFLHFPRPHALAQNTAMNVVRAALFLLPGLCLVAACGPKHDARHAPKRSGPAAAEERVQDGGSLPAGDGGPDPLGPGGNDAAQAEFGLDERPHNTSCVSPERPTLTSSVALEPVFAGLTLDRPLGLYQAPDGSFFVIEQTGKVKRFINNPRVSSSDTLLELDTAFGDGNDERGLLGFAFHPDFAHNRFVYVNFVDDADGLASHVDRYTLSGDGKELAQKKRILTLAQPYSNHNGGNLVFGPDGYLYIGFGDGGSGGDPHGNGQKLDTLLGKMLRIDVDHGDPYGIPGSNPYKSGGGKPEIFAHGLRNPWRYSFDRDTGELWAGDVGQNCFEEVSIIERAKNYGWNRVEGPSCYSSHGCTIRDDCNRTGLTPPVLYYGRDQGQSITGGFVYRGSAVPALEGAYVYGDFASGRIWAARKIGSTYQAELLLESGLAIASFAEDRAGELYVVDRGRDANDGAIHRVIAAHGVAHDTLPAKLSQTGCVDPQHPTEVVAALIPYQPRVPFWSDQAEKERWLALPDGAQIHVTDEGDFELPRGGLAMKTFWLKGRRVETRFYVRYADGSYGGYAYLWNAQQTDARLLSGPTSVRVAGVPWVVPSRGQCQACHDPISAGHLGLERLQLDFPLSYATGKRANQIATLAHLGMLDRPPTGAFAALPDVADEQVALDTRARAYLHANCAYCHRPGGPGRGALDLRFGATRARLCNEAPQEGDLGVPGAKLLTPGASAKSIVYLRMIRRDSRGMPPLASTLVDTKGSQLIKRWIDGMTACEQ
jgi:uncharacterized repeat protein (TIGR03806 family)